MDAPQISTLREERTPSPPTRTSKFRVKLLVNEGRGAPPTATLGAKKQVSNGNDDDAEEEDEEDEEDQLIDDDDVNPTPLSRPPDATKRKPSSKRKAKKSEKQLAEDERKKQAKILIGPTEPEVEAPSLEVDQFDVGPVSSGLLTFEPLKPSKKNPSPRKAPAAPRKKAKPAPKVLKNPLISVEDLGNVSDGYTGTAASSPVAAHFDMNTPEPEHNGLIMAPAQAAEDGNLENVPLPIYPLPSKPFPVQPPHKIGTGFAPMIPLDRSGSKVRRWRTANREVRGIGGGRWFARAWVGEKESEYASAAASKGGADTDKQAGTVSIPKLSGISISGKGSGKKSSKAQSAASAGTSRAGSVIPDSGSHAPRSPTKMRTIIVASEPEGPNDLENAMVS